ncbi:hypothetical protein DAEQUDRAFT_741901 [Daedalea quercina L-15889]|uniref:Uncharacterized protein n=1 Tax=Daedalea quercina L-15889 TaxID=1314783 RepID=A0A165KQV1_9APHY|nr:hypothetical protein DAEQUDRAFT_741901 [Daedalea quercina L-15889]
MYDRPEQDPWYPFGSKAMFILDLLDNLPRLRLSNDHFKVILWALKELGVHGVLALSAFRKKQESLQKECGIHTDAKCSPDGSVFYQNRTADLISLWLDDEHAIVTLISGLRQSQWYHTPMWARGSIHWFVGELAQLNSGKLVIPHAWFRYCSGGAVYAEGYEVIVRADGHSLDAKLDTTIIFPASDLQFNYFDLAAYGLSDKLAGMRTLPRMLASAPHNHSLSGPLPKGAWGDDVSGNRSKQYNEHTNIYLAHANLPHAKLSQEYFGEVLFRIIPCLFPADNPQASESCSHIGLHGNKWCRRCMLGGTEREHETDEGYEAHFKVDPNKLRNATQTVHEVQTQIRLAALGIKQDITDQQRESGVKDKLAEHWIKILLERARDEQKRRIPTDARLKGLHGEERAHLVLEVKKEIQAELLEWLVQQPPDSYNNLPADSPLRTQLRPGDHFNSLLTLDGIDIHRETPVELLHTYLLGQVKYVWHFTHSSWSAKHLDFFATRLQASSVNGLNVMPIRARYIVQYKDNLIGKHFKVLQQLGIFHLDDSMCPEIVQELWKATGELGALLWFTEIDDMDTYLSDLAVLIANVLDIWSLIDPKRIFVKPKLHLLLHLLFDIGDHGPAGFVLSNHQAPSRDIAWACADMDRFKHQVSGGWWLNNAGHFVQAGENIQQYFNSPELQRRLGYVHRSQPSPGTIHSKKSKPKIITWELVSHRQPALGDRHRPDTQWIDCISVAARTGDICKARSWVIYEYDGTTLVGRVEQILKSAPDQVAQDACSDPLEDVIIVERHFRMPELLKIPDESFDPVKPQVHGILNAPSPLYTSSGFDETSLMLLQDVVCILNVQHNCYDKRTLTEAEEPCIEHKDDERYLINTHALHNAALLRKILPRHLTAPIPFIDPAKREAEHLKMAASLRTTQSDRRAKGAEARSERRKQAASKSDVNDPNHGKTTQGVPGNPPRPQPRKRARVADHDESDIRGGERVVRQGGDSFAGTPQLLAESV